MATKNTNPPPLRVPRKLQSDQELAGFFNRLTKDLYLIWEKTGAGGIVAITEGGTGADNEADARVNLGVEIGVDVQAWDAGLESIAGLTTAADRMIYTTAHDAYAVTVLTAAGRALLDDANAPAQRTTLDVYSKSEVDAISEEDRRYTLLMGVI